MSELEPDKYLLCTHSLNATICMENRIVKNILVQRIQELCSREIKRGVEISMLWIPSHMGIRGNDLAGWQIKQLKRVLDVHRSLFQYLIGTGSPISREGCMSSGRRVGESRGETFIC